MIPPLFVSAALGAAAVLASDTGSHGRALVEWLRSKRRGTFNPKLEIRRADPDDPDSFYGIFASDYIAAKELLLKIPPDCLINAGLPDIGDRVMVDYNEEGEWFGATVVAVNADGTYDVHFDEGDDEGGVGPHHIKKSMQGALQCDTLKNFIREMRLGDESDFAPYVNYLLEQSPGQLPRAWSEEGKALLLDVLQGELPPDGAVDMFHHVACDGINDDFDENAAMLQLQRCFDDVLIPIFDMMSHRNGRWHNTREDSILWSKNTVVRASRDIKAGEQIYTSYNFCTDCGGRAFGYGTPEILRDYGFVEQYPQRWFFYGGVVAFEVDESDTGDLKVSWLEGRTISSMQIIRHLEGHIERLEHLTETKLKSPEEAVPMNELDVIRQYCEALIVALTHAIETATTEDNPDCLIRDNDGVCTAFSSDLIYDELQEEDDDRTYGRDVELRTFGYELLEYLESPYQALSFRQHPDTKDTCMVLDGIVQTCGSFRPHYHDISVHFTARYINEIKRVLWVGGGDSMLLHEIIKYPSLEFVVGLEIDQTVTRKCFKHFGTQPHWDNPKVQWWYGDAAKSLLMLPKDYFGSFDLVLVDLSETVIADEVSEELDIMGALALLLKPEGILVKNELYLGQMSDIFDYTIQVHVYDVPHIFSQAFIMGSNGVDFLTTTPKDHNVEVTWPAHVGPLDKTMDSHYEVIHDYRRNTSRDKEHCKEQDEVGPAEELHEQEKSPGILMIVEAEDATAMLQPSEKVTETITKALNEEGLTVVSTVASPFNDKGVSVAVILHEGYVVARTWPEHKYCAFDIHLWSSFEKHENVKKALITAVGSGLEGKSSSSYRIVAGGMYGVSTWKEDEKNRGLHVVQPCESPAGSLRNACMDPSAVDAVLEESMTLVRDGDVLAAVVCGHQERPCGSLEALKRSGKVRDVVALWTCPSIKDIGEHSELIDVLKIMSSCEQEVVKTLGEEVSEDKKLGVIIVDSSAPFLMGQIVHHIFGTPKNKEHMLKDDIVAMAPMLNSTETWRRSFLDRFRRDIIGDEPVFRAEVLLNSSDSSMEMGIISSGDPHFAQHLLDVMARVEMRSDLVSDVRNIQRGLFEWQEEFEVSRFYLPGDYDKTSPFEQWSSQQPLGHQTVFQLEVDTSLAVGDKVQANYEEEGEWFRGTVARVYSDNSYDVQYDDGDQERGVRSQHIHKDLGGAMVYDTVINLIQNSRDSGESDFSNYANQLLTTDQVKRALREVLSLMKAEDMSSAEVQEFSDAGDGCVLVALWPGGSVVVLWDGRVHVDINLFMNFGQDPNEFVTHFTAQIPMLKTVLRDEQPRGYGRVVNFPDDIGSRADPHWV